MSNNALADAFEWLLVRATPPNWAVYPWSDKALDEIRRAYIKRQERRTTMSEAKRFRVNDRGLHDDKGMSYGIGHTHASQMLCRLLNSLHDAAESAKRLLATEQERHQAALSALADAGRATVNLAESLTAQRVVEAAAAESSAERAVEGPHTGWHADRLSDARASRRAAVDAHRAASLPKARARVVDAAWRINGMEMWTVVVGDFPKDYKIDSFYRQQDAITGDDAGRSAAEARAIALNSGGAK